MDSGLDWGYKGLMQFDGRHAGSIEIRKADGTDDLDECRTIRRQVFIEEQGVSEDEEWDGLDDRCTHFLAVAGTRAVGTARLLITNKGQARAQRVAVLPDLRGHDIGRLLMEALEKEACDQGFREVVLDGQVQAIPFYEKTGYIAEGPEFLDAGIPHRLMRKSIMGN